MRIRPNCVLEQELWGRGVRAVAGVDEVGVGAIAGPVMAAAVILASDAIVDGLADSKLLTPKRREALFGVISERAVAIGIEQVEAEELDRLNVYWAAIGGTSASGGRATNACGPYFGRWQAPHSRLPPAADCGYRWRRS
jgi:hypothetical protein